MKPDESVCVNRPARRIWCRREPTRQCRPSPGDDPHGFRSRFVSEMTLCRGTGAMKHPGNRSRAADGLAAKGGLPSIFAAGRRCTHRESNRGATFAAKGPGRGTRLTAVPYCRLVEANLEDQWNAAIKGPQPALSAARKRQTQFILRSGRVKSEGRRVKGGSESRRRSPCFTLYPLLFTLSQATKNPVRRGRGE
ncbi:MAG: hypothetical protein JWN24_1881 [Phycisphaerales bacterium]|nr:hypothetical protein [Phycisphaerales bacterium]